MASLLGMGILQFLGMILLYDVMRVSVKNAHYTHLSIHVKKLPFGARGDCGWTTIES